MTDWFLPNWDINGVELGRFPICIKQTFQYWLESKLLRLGSNLFQEGSQRNLLLKCGSAIINSLRIQSYWTRKQQRSISNERRENVESEKPTQFHILVYRYTCICRYERHVNFEITSNSYKTDLLWYTQSFSVCQRQICK